MLVEDHPVMRLGTKLSLMTSDSDLDVVQEADNIANAILFLKENKPIDLILLDLNLPDGNGVEVVRFVKQKRPEIKILVYSVDSNPDVLRQLMDMGINGFVSKNVSSHELVVSIQTVMAGLEYYGKDTAQLINDIKVSLNKEENIFTERELEVVRYCAQGLMAKEIADKMDISIRTVDNFKQKIFKKMGFTSTAELVLYAYQSGIVTL